MAHTRIPFALFLDPKQTLIDAQLLAEIHECSQEKQEVRKSDHEAGGDDLDDDFAAGSGSGEEESGSEDGGDGDSDEDGSGALQRRQKERAAGDHELQARLR